MIFVLRTMKNGSRRGMMCVEVPPELDDIQDGVEAWLVETCGTPPNWTEAQLAREKVPPPRWSGEPFLRTQVVDWQVGADYDVQYTHRVRDFFDLVSEGEWPADRSGEMYTTFSCLPWEFEKAYYWRPRPTFWDALPERLWAHLLDRYRADDAYQEVKNTLIDVFEVAGRKRWPYVPPPPEPEAVSRFEREALL